MNKKLTRSTNNRMIAGVAGGLAEYLNIDPVIVRLVFLLLALAKGPGIVLYIILWLITPEADVVYEIKVTNG